MRKQKIGRWVCYAIVASLLSLTVPAVGEQPSIETLLDEGTTIESIQPGKANGPYAHAILQRDGMDAVAVFLLVDGQWTLQAESPWFPADSYGAVSVEGADENSFHVRFDAVDGSSSGSYYFEKTDEGWQAMSFDGENLRWSLQEDGASLRYDDDSEHESLPYAWRVMLTDILFPRMPQTMGEMRVLLLTGNVARLTLAEYATMPLRQEPTAEASYTCVLIDGAVLDMLDRRDGWVQVALDNYITGWVPETALEIGNLGYRFHYNNDMTAINGSLIVYAGPSLSAEVRQKLTGWPAMEIAGWCGGAFSDVSDGVWALVYNQDGIGYVRLRSLCYGNG